MSQKKVQHPALKAGNAAVITGGASGIGFAAAKAFIALGMNVMIADMKSEKLKAAGAALADLAEKKGVKALYYAADVSDLSALEELECAAVRAFGKVDVLMNNAGIQPKTSILGKQIAWDRIIDVNLLGVIYGTRIFAPGMLEHGEPALIINTGSKQGITTPPGNPAYNVSKAGVKAFTEALQHELRNSENGNVEAHLLIPGFVFTPLTAGGLTEKPEGAWTPEQTVDFMLESLAEGDFYILCPDGEVDRETDEKRMMWAMGDIVENRPPLSRWHPDYHNAFAEFLSGKHQEPKD